MRSIIAGEGVNKGKENTNYVRKYFFSLSRQGASRGTLFYYPSRERAHLFSHGSTDYAKTLPKEYNPQKNEKMNERSVPFNIFLCTLSLGPFWNLLYGPLYREWSSEWGQSVFPNMTPYLPPPLKQLYFFYCVDLCLFLFLDLFLYLQSSEREQSVFPNTTPCLPPPLWAWPVTIVVFFLLFALDSLPSIILSYLLIFHQWPWGFLPPRKLCLPKEIPWIPLYWILKSVFSCSAPIISSSQMSQLRDWAWHSICQKCY